MWLFWLLLLTFVLVNAMQAFSSSRRPDTRMASRSFKDMEVNDRTTNNRQTLNYQSARGVSLNFVVESSNAFLEHGHLGRNATSDRLQTSDFSHRVRDEEELVNQFGACLFHSVRHLWNSIHCKVHEMDKTTSCLTSEKHQQLLQGVWPGLIFWFIDRQVGPQLPRFCVGFLRVRQNLKAQRIV